MPPRNTRRDFLLGRAAADSVADLAQRALDALRNDEDEESYLLRVDRQAMACTFEVCLNVGQYPQGTEAALAALDLLGPLEEQLSYFRQTSAISRINARAAYEPVSVEPSLFGLLEQCVALYRETEGAFDITSAPLWKAWGFARRAGAVPSPADLDAARACTGSQFLVLDADSHTVRFLREGMEINLGCIGKGHAIDACGRSLTAAGIGNYLVHGAGSSVRVQGSRGVRDTPPEGVGSNGDASLRGWVVGLRHPTRAEGRVGAIRLQGQAIGTSGSRHQSFRHAGRRYSHIVDPRTGTPSDAVLSVTVVAPTATLADGLSTAFFVMGPEATQAYCEEHPNIGVVAFLPEGGGRPWNVAMWNILPTNIAMDSI